MITKINVPKSRKSVTFIDNVVYSKTISPLQGLEIELKMSIMTQFGNSETNNAPWTGEPVEVIEKKPAIVWIPGGGWRGVDKNLMTPEMKFLADDGFVVASIYYRSSAEAIFPAQIIDVKSAIRYLRANAEKYFIDPDRIAVIGRSAGGHLTALTCMNIPGYDFGDNLEYSSEVKCGVDLFGPADLVKMLEMERGKVGPGARWETVEESHAGALLGGTEISKPELAKDASPALRVNEKTVPMLVIHGDADPAVPFEQSVLMHDNMNKMGRQCDLFLISGAGHGTDEFWQTDVKAIIQTFFDKHLKL